MEVFHWAAAARTWGGRVTSQSQLQIAACPCLPTWDRLQSAANVRDIRGWQAQYISVVQ